MLRLLPGPPSAALWRGCAAWLQGRHDGAFALWRRCLAEAERFGLAYERARAHYEIGRRLEPTDPERLVHLTRAEVEFPRFLSDPDVKRVDTVFRGG